LISAGDWACERYSEARRSSTMVLSSRIASSTSVFVRRREPGREDGAVFARLREGEGRRDRTRAGDRVPEVRERRIAIGFPIKGSASSDGSGQMDRVGVCIVAIVVPERRRSSGKYPQYEAFEDNELVLESLTRTSACAGLSRTIKVVLQAPSLSKSGSGDSRPFGR
jgi:hypothetical protein